MNPLTWLNPGRWLLYLALAAALVAGFFAWQSHERGIGREEGRAEVQGKWDKEKIAQQEAVIAENQANAKETQRRLERQKENQDAQDKELAAARGDAVRNSADADRLRDQNADTAKRWRDALRNTPACIECAPAGDAIVVLADVLARADRRAGDLAAYADTTRTAGLKCERDYDALTK